MEYTWGVVMNIQGGIPVDIPLHVMWVIGYVMDMRWGGKRGQKGVQKGSQNGSK